MKSGDRDVPGSGAATEAWLYWLFPALTMSLGWGLRGFIGGGPLGAMIPGAAVALALCLLLGRKHDAAGLAAAFGAVGVGFGGEMTYGQTVGFIVQPATFYWGLAGLAVKGAVWGLLGGAVLGLGLVREQLRRGQLVAALALIVAGAHLGWKRINEPKLIYFSNLADRPRPEIWAGLLLGALLLLLWLARTGKAKMPALFAAAGAAGGGIGFGLGGVLMVLGRGLPVEQRWFDWWKLMEFTFGFCFGLALGVIAHRLRRELEGGEGPASAPATWKVMAATAVLAAALFGWEASEPLRYSFAVAGVALLTAALFWTSLGWQIAVTLTYSAAAIDLAEYHLERKLDAPAAAWSFAIASSVVVCYLVARRRASGRPMPAWCYLLLIWACLAISWLKTLIGPRPLYGHLVVELIFTAAAVL
ncbi:MAG: hypothetical protein AAB225_05020, partial [Acidobacteriota bacterium]